MKKILVVTYSQTGQLDNIVNSILKPLEDENISITHHEVVPKKPYPYPWNVVNFMDAFPESIYMVPCELEEIEDENEYDLVILGYQIWFLSPSIPISSFLQSNYAKEKLKGKPVITVVGCRNMWIMAQERICSLFDKIGAKQIDNIVLIDENPSYLTFFTTPKWLLFGNPDGFWKFFPKAGLSEKQIKSASRFGKAIKEGLILNKEKSFQSLCKGLKACFVNEKIIASEKIATRSFKIWGKLIRKFGEPGDKKRVPIVLLYLAFLVIIVLTVVPINMLIQTIIRKFNPQKIKKQKQLYSLPSGESDERMEEFR